VFVVIGWGNYFGFWFYGTHLKSALYTVTYKLLKCKMNSTEFNNCRLKKTILKREAIADKRKVSLKIIDNRLLFCTAERESLSCGVAKAQNTGKFMISRGVRTNGISL